MPSVSQKGLGRAMAPFGCRLPIDRINHMKKFAMTFALRLSAVFALGFLGCTHANTDHKTNPIVGAWFVKNPGAPFP
jgi:hypothetical protein